MRLLLILFIIHNTVYNDYWTGEHYTEVKSQAKRFTKSEAVRVREQLFKASEYCDREPFRIERVR